MAGSAIVNGVEFPQPCGSRRCRRAFDTVEDGFELDSHRRPRGVVVRRRRSWRDAISIHQGNYAAASRQTQARSDHPAQRTERLPSMATIQNWRRRPACKATWPRHRRTATVASESQRCVVEMSPPKRRRCRGAVDTADQPPSKLAAATSTARFQQRGGVLRRETQRASRQLPPAQRLMIGASTTSATKPARPGAMRSTAERRAVLPDQPKAASQQQQAEPFPYFLYSREVAMADPERDQYRRHGNNTRNDVQDGIQRTIGHDSPKGSDISRPLARRTSSDSSAGRTSRRHNPHRHFGRERREFSSPPACLVLIRHVQPSGSAGM